jgi:hypothetical protein
MLAMASDEHQRLICHGSKLDKVCVECFLALFLRFQPQRPVSMASPSSLHNLACYAGRMMHKYVLRATYHSL